MRCLSHFRDRLAIQDLVLQICTFVSNNPSLHLLKSLRFNRDFIMMIEGTMKAESQAQVKSILDFTTHLVETLNRSRDDAQQICPDVLPYISILPLSPADASKSQRTAVRDHAIKIWNICNHLTVADDSDSRSNAAKLRAFACLLLTSIVPNKARSPTNVSNLFLNTLVAGKACLKASMLDLADTVLQNEAAIAFLDTKVDKGAGNPRPAHSHMIEYFCLRALLEWKRKRLDLTEYWYRRIGQSGLQLPESDVEKMIDLCYEIGRDCLSQDNEGAMAGAPIWLERALATLDQEYYMRLFVGSDLRLNVMHCLVQACARLPDYSSHEKALEILERLKSEYGSRLPVLLLGLEVLRGHASSALDGEACGLQIDELARSVHLIEANHRLIIYYIRQLNNESHCRASNCLKSYVLHRLIPEGKSEWIEEAVVIRVAMTADRQPTDATVSLQALEQDLTSFAEGFKTELHTSAAQAAHALIWKIIRETDTDNTRSLAMLWCQIGLHPIFAAAGEAGVGKLERQLISYHLLVSNTGLAHQMLEQMSFVQKNNRSSRYLAYCVAIRSGNDADAQSCLNTITNGQGENDQLLFACIGESIKHGKFLNTARLALRLLEKQLQDPSLNSDVGVLLQYTAKTFLQVVAEQTLQHDSEREIPARLCWIFKHAARFHSIPNSSTTGLVQSKVEASWFERSSFNLAGTHMKTWPRRYTIDLLEYCRQLCEPQAGVLAEVTQTQRSVTHLHECSFLQAILYAIEARNVSANYSVEDLPESSYESRSKPKTSECREVLHKSVFRIFLMLQKHFTETATFDSDSSGTLKSQLHVLTPLALEALLFLSVNTCLSNGTNFDETSIHQFLQTINELEIPVASYAVLADTLLAFTADTAEREGLRVPRATAASLLGRIVHALRQAPSYNVEQAARWIRCAAQLIFDEVEATLANERSEEPPKLAQSLAMLESLTAQAVNLAKATPSRSKQEANVKAQREAGGIVKGIHPYPEEEVQWLVTKVWNMAIDLHGIGQHATAMTWAGKALRMAELVARGEGNLAGVVEQLKDNMKQLGWDA